MTLKHLAVVGLVAGTSLSLGCRASEPYVTPVTPVTIALAHESTDATGIRYSGSAIAAQEVPVAFKLGGYVDDVLSTRDDRGQMRRVQAGDHVAKGAVLARIRPADYEQKVAQARAGVAEGEAMLAVARLDLERATRLYERRSLTKPEFDGARAKVDATAARVDGARAMLRETELLLDDVALKAPISGVVLRRMVEAGALAGPGTPAFLLADTTSVKVVFGVPDTVVKTLKAGQTQRVTFDAIPGENFEGRITAIAPASDPVTRVYQIEVTLPNREQRVEIGFIASLRLSDVTTSSVVTVPLESIVKPPAGKGDGYAVYIVEGTADTTVARLRPVTLGDAIGNDIVVSSGLASGDRVLVRGATIVTDGERVRILPPTGTP